MPGGGFFLFLGWGSVTPSGPPSVDRRLGGDQKTAMDHAPTDLPLGPIVTDAEPAMPAPQRHIGRSVSLEPLLTSHTAELWDAARSAEASWTYLRYGPFPTEAALGAHVERLVGLPHQPFFAVVPATSGRAEGWLSLCDISPANSSIEIGSVWFSPRLQRTRAATEAVYLLLRHAFGLGYHRMVWRSNALNAASMRAARRFGFTFEGIWRGAEVAKGRRRDTAWFSMLAQEWPAHRHRFETWLDDSNFDSSGTARRPMAP